MQIGNCILIYELGAIFHVGQYLESPILNVFYNIGPQMCKSRCIRTVGCNSFNFVKSLMYCELLNSTQSVIPVNKSHYMYSNMSTWTIVSTYIFKCLHKVIRILFPFMNKLSERIPQCIQIFIET